MHLQTLTSTFSCGNPGSENLGNPGSETGETGLRRLGEPLAVAEEPGEAAPSVGSLGR